jgi:hypothetical protein
MRAADLVEDLALERSPGETAKLADELAHRAHLAQIAISGHMRG